MICWSIDSFTSWLKHIVYPDAVDDLKLDNAVCEADTSSSDDNDDDDDDDDELHYGATVDLTPYGQQELKSWRVRTTTPGTMKITFSCGIVVFLLGCLVEHKSREAAQVRVVYQASKQGRTALASEIPWGTIDNEVFNLDSCDSNPGTKYSCLTCTVTVPR